MKIAVGLSGGVDSAVAALLLKRQGHEVIGVTMKLWREGRYSGGVRDACFGPGEADDIAAAESFAKSIGIEYRVFDCADEYERNVLEYFRRVKSEGRTPNPCVVCNRRMKFGLLPEIAAKHIDFERFATGHYARRTIAADGRFAIARAADLKKDQSYFLWRLGQDQIERAMFPLSELTKSEVRQIAAGAGLPMADKDDSQDFYSGDCGDLLRVRGEPGEIVTVDGTVVGRHEGLWRYTVGQRQGLGIGGGGKRFYVVRLDKKKNALIVGSRDDAVCREFAIGEMNWMAANETAGRIEGFVKVRSTGEPAGPVAFENGRVTAPNGIFGVAPGQSAVLYSAEGVILCGGEIV